MPNTRIQIRRSSATATPTNGSLQAGELAYSYNSDKLFVGNTAGTGVVEIGGKYYVDLINAAFNQVNTVAISANSYASAVGVAANTYAAAVGVSANAFAVTIGASSNSYAAAVGVAANSYAAAVGVSANAFAVTIGASSNSYAAAVGVSANSYSAAVGVSANSYTDTNFVKLIASNQTITGNLAVTGSLTVSGNSFSIDTQTLRVSDPLIYLAGNNYASDIVDIGFVANYVNATGTNVHTGIFRDATIKEYYVFQGYDQEPIPNHIDTAGNNFTLAVLNAVIRTSNLILGGANAITTISNVGVAANSYAAAVGVAANTYAAAVGVAANGYTNSTNTYLLSVIAGANTAVGAGANSYAAAVGVAANSYAAAVGVSANSYAATVGAAANTNAANATYLSTGTVPSARISGSYTGITGVGTITAGVWNGSTVTVPYGGTGMTSFTSNGILYGNTAGDLKVTAAGTEGQVLQASATGIPNFAMLDGGTF